MRLLRYAKVFTTKEYGKWAAEAALQLAALEEEVKFPSIVDDVLPELATAMKEELSALRSEVCMYGTLDHG